MCIYICCVFELITWLHLFCTCSWYTCIVHWVPVITFFLFRIFMFNLFPGLQLWVIIFSFGVLYFGFVWAFQRLPSLYHNHSRPRCFSITVVLVSVQSTNCQPEPSYWLRARDVKDTCSHITMRQECEPGSTQRVWQLLSARSDKTASDRPSVTQLVMLKVDPLLAPCCAHRTVSSDWLCHKFIYRWLFTLM